MLLTAARPGELASLKVADFSKSQGTLDLEGKTGRRTATVSSAACQFFTEQSKAKLPTAPLLSREYGDHWNKDSWKKMFKDAVKRARLPTDTVMYTLRHVAITELIMGGMDSFVVARLAGTSVAMIEKHYGHLRHQETRLKLDSVRMI
jgi:integrase